VALAQSRANLLLPAGPRGRPKKLVEVHLKSSRDVIGTEAFLGRNDVTSTEKIENIFLERVLETSVVMVWCKKSGRESEHTHWQGQLEQHEHFSFSHGDRGHD
jgi:hypothetical protein